MGCHMFRHSCPPNATYQPPGPARYRPVLRISLPPLGRPFSPQVASPCLSMPPLARYFLSSGGGTRTPDTRIMIPLLSRHKSIPHPGWTYGKSRDGMAATCHHRPRR